MSIQISALVVICMSSYVFISRLEDLDSSKFSGYGVPDNISPNKDENEKFHEMLIKMNKLWTKYRSILVSSSALAIVSGLLQATFSVLTVFGDSKVSYIIKTLDNMHVFYLNYNV